MNVLAIGNSFSQDATRYLHKIAKKDGVDMTVVNLPIGSCSLSRHYRNILENEKAYGMEFNGEPTGFFVSVKDALLTRDWDFVTMQQVSGDSFKIDSYQPYLSEFSAYIKKYAPKAKQVIHQTWAYEEGSDMLCNTFGFASHEEMFKLIEAAYEKAASDINADRIIKSGKLFNEFTKAGLKIHRDMFHSTLGFGRYALGLLWYRTLTGNDVTNNTFCCTDEPLTEEEFNTAKTFVQNLEL